MTPFAGTDTPLYRHLSPELHRLALKGIVRSFPRKSLLIVEGDTSEGLFVLLSGSVKVFSTSGGGREITFGMVGAGDYFGEMSLDGGPRSASVMAIEPCICALLNRADIDRHLAEEPGFAINLVIHAIRRARAATEVARKMALLDVYGRLVSVLEESITSLRPLDATPPHSLEATTHREIASRVGASREMVSRLLKDLEKGGYIEMSAKRITVLKKLPTRW